MKPTNCPKCQAAMEEGYLLDRTRGGMIPGDCVEGPPEPSVWFGLKLGGREHLRIIALRCPLCGYLEHYAPSSETG
jgi:predicted nucleic-acid-binding Zn-ribbon protein